MLHGKINTGKRLAALALCGLFALQAPAVPAMAAETLTVQDQGFYRIDGTKIEGAVAKGVTISKYQNQAGPIDWDAMKADGVTFAMIRVGYLNDLDPYFKENVGRMTQKRIDKIIAAMPDEVHVEKYTSDYGNSYFAVSENDLNEWRKASGLKKK